MGIAGGHWLGSVRLVAGDSLGRDEEGVDLLVPAGRVLVQFGGEAGIGVGFDEDDPFLLPAPEDIAALAAADQARRAQFDLEHGSPDEPCFPEGHFDRR